MITKTEKKQHMYCKSYKYDTKTSHRETYFITTWYFLGIPIYKNYKLIDDNIHQN